MPHRQHIHLGQVPVLHQPGLDVGPHIPGEQGGEVPCPAQQGQALLVGLPRPQRGVEGQLGGAEGQPGVLPHQPDLGSLFLRQGQQLPPQRVVRLHVRDGQHVHPHPLQQFGHSVGVVGVEVGQHQQVQRVPPPVPQVVRRQVPGIALAAAAVHQGGPRPAAQQSALPLAHVQRHQGEPGRGVGQPGQHQADAQGADAGADGQHIPPLPPPGAAQQENAVDKGQPGHQIGAGERQGGEGQVRQMPGHPQQPAGKGRDQRGQRSAHGGNGHAQSRRRQAQGEHQLHTPQAQQVGQWGDQRDRAELPGRQGCGEGQGPAGAGKGGHQQADGLVAPALPALPGRFQVQFVPQKALQPPGKGQEPHHGGEGELEADAVDGVGVLDQQQEQGEGQTGGRIGLPAQQRGQEQQPLHHHCPDHRGGAPHRQGVEGQQRQGQEGSAAAVPPQELDGHPHQEGDVQAGDRHGMGQPGALEGPVVRVGQPGLVAGEEGPDQGRHLRREERLHSPPQATGRASIEGAPGPGAPPSAPPHWRRPAGRRPGRGRSRRPRPGPDPPGGTGR